MNKSNKNIGLFGGSFNPPHAGHVAVLRDLTRLDNFDEIWVVPVFQHPFGKDLAAFAERVKMLELVVKHLETDKVRVEKIEGQMAQNPSYTFDMVSELKKKFPTHHFTLILGSDAKKDLPKWHRLGELKKIVDFYFIPRAGIENSPYPDVSSTDIRKKLELGKSIDKLTLPKIADYILKIKLY